MSDQYHLNPDRAEAGYTQEALKATELIAKMLVGFTTQLAYSILMNALAMVICSLCTNSEQQALDQARMFRRELERTIRKNWVHFQKAKEEGKQ